MDAVPAFSRIWYSFGILAQRHYRAYYRLLRSRLAALVEKPKQEDVSMEGDNEEDADAHKHAYSSQ
jgi:hypothetical protein